MYLSVCLSVTNTHTNNTAVHHGLGLLTKRTYLVRTLYLLQKVPAMAM